MALFSYYVRPVINLLLSCQYIGLVLGMFSTPLEMTLDSAMSFRAKSGKTFTRADIYQHNLANPLSFRVQSGKQK